MKPYIVTLHPDVDYNQFWTEVENSTTDLEFIPSRAVEIHNEQTYLNRNCTYLLSDNEANLLRNDPRVLGVEDTSGLLSSDEAVQYGNFNKVTTPGSFTANANPYDFFCEGNYANWGLDRVNNNSEKTYNYTLDGTGVDVIIVDGGLEADHPEFQDANGQSRVQKIEWYDYSPELDKPTGFTSAEMYVDIHGHGTHVAGIAVGKTYGWGKNANIYAIKNGDQITPNSDKGISFMSGRIPELILGFHANKAADPVTGQKRPTVVNISSGYYYKNAPTPESGAYIHYRGQVIYANTVGYGETIIDSYIASPSNLLSDEQSFTGAVNIKNWCGAKDPTHDYSSGLMDYGLMTTTITANVAAINSYVDQMIDAGIHVCIAAGNGYNKIDRAGGVDHNNHIFLNNTEYYYNQGASPWSNRAIVVGAIDQVTHVSGLEQKALFSACGPGVDVYAPGVGIVSSISKESSMAINKRYSVFPYNDDHNYQQAAVSGTSMASPQVAGLATLFLQVNPNLDPVQLKRAIIKNAQPVIYTTGNINNYGDYTDLRSVCSNLAPLMLYNPYNASKDTLAQGGITITTAGTQ